jgi:predicted ATPase
VVFSRLASSTSKRDIPYATLGQAFQNLVRPLLGQSEAELGRWRDALSEALGPNGQLIVNLVPALELVIGKQPPVSDLPPRDAQNRFQIAFRRFLGVFARKEHPLALFLDDLQWLDAATIDLLEHLITQAEVRHLLLVGAYRDNEVNSAHPLLRAVDAIRKAGARIDEIVLAPLGLHDVGRLVADALHLRTGARVAPGATGAGEDRRESVLRDPVLHGVGQRGSALVRPSRVSLAMEHRPHPRWELHRQRGGAGWPGS